MQQAYEQYFNVDHGYELRKVTLTGLKRTVTGGPNPRVLYQAVRRYWFLGWRSRCVWIHEDNIEWHDPVKVTDSLFIPEGNQCTQS